MGGADLAAVWARARASLRAHWRSWAVLTVLAGLAGGVATTAAQRFGLEPGSTLTMQVLGPGAFQQAAAQGPEVLAALFRSTPFRRFRVTGVVAMQGAFPPALPSTGILPPIVMSTTFARSHP